MWDAVCDVRDVLQTNLPQSVSKHMLSISDYQCFVTRNPDLALLQAELDDSINKSEAVEIKKIKQMVRNAVSDSAYALSRHSLHNSNTVRTF